MPPYPPRKLGPFGPSILLVGASRLNTKPSQKNVNTHEVLAWHRPWYYYSVVDRTWMSKRIKIVILPIVSVNINLD